MFMDTVVAFHYDHNTSLLHGIMKFYQGLALLTHLHAHPQLIVLEMEERHQWGQHPQVISKFVDQGIFIELF